MRTLEDFLFYYLANRRALPSTIQNFAHYRYDGYVGGSIDGTIDGDIDVSSNTSVTEHSPGVPRLLFMRHGILLNRFFMAPMATFLRRRGFTVHNTSYPSTRKTIQDHARDLYEEVRSVRESAGNQDAEIYFVTHSLGGLVLRYMLTHHEVPGVCRAVQIVPPNQGAETARRLKDDFGFKLLYGRHAGRQLTEDPSGIFTECGIPADIDLGIIAGVSTPPMIIPTPLDTPHDCVVARSETVLGNFPVLDLRVGHTIALFVPAVWRQVAAFLDSGSFLEIEPEI